MDEVPSELRFLESHEWAKKEDGELFAVGISQHAQSMLGDVVFVELPEIGQELKAGSEAGVVESVKAASDIYSPLSGEVIEVNESLRDNPELINSDPYQGGWIFKLKAQDVGEWDALIEADKYQVQVAEEH